MDRFCARVESTGKLLPVRESDSVRTVSILDALCTASAVRSAESGPSSGGDAYRFEPERVKTWSPRTAQAIQHATDEERPRELESNHLKWL
jgi:hypothetical protein